MVHISRLLAACPAPRRVCGRCVADLKWRGRFTFRRWPCKCPINSMYPVSGGGQGTGLVTLEAGAEPSSEPGAPFSDHGGQCRLRLRVRPGSHPGSCPLKSRLSAALTPIVKGISLWDRDRCQRSQFPPGNRRAAGPSFKTLWRAKAGLLRRLQVWAWTHQLSWFSCLVWKARASLVPRS